MTDLEMIVLCAKAMRVPYCDSISELDNYGYDPLHDDAQAMALVKKFLLLITPMIDGTKHEGWCADHGDTITPKITCSRDLNRAICECVAKMRKANEKVAA